MKYIAVIMILLVSTLVIGCTADSKAKRIAQFDMIWPKLKNPDTAYSDGFRVIDKYTFQHKGGAKAEQRTHWFIHGVVVAQNSFGAKLKSGYCVTFITIDGTDRYFPGHINECDRQGPSSSEVSLMKALSDWNPQK